VCAADAWLTPVLMKKGRPAHTVSVLCPPAARDALRSVIFRQTTTLGVREHPVERHSLRRDWRAVPVREGQVRVKVSLDDAGLVVHATPEYEDAGALAQEAGAPVRELLDEAVAAAHAAGIRPGHPLPGQG
jgi:uncharacterized protein (DUF111 family)